MREAELRRPAPGSDQMGLLALVKRLQERLAVDFGEPPQEVLVESRSQDRGCAEHTSRPVGHARAQGPAATIAGTFRSLLG